MKKRKIITKLIHENVSIPSIDVVNAVYTRQKRKSEVEDREAYIQWERKTRIKINKELMTQGYSRILIREAEGGCYNLVKISRKIVADYQAHGYGVKVEYDFSTTPYYSAEYPILYDVKIISSNFS